MKRSEARNHIVNVLRLTGYHWCDHGRDEQDADRILKRMEAIGMLPPFNEDSWYLDGDHADQSDVIYRTWET